MNKTIIYRPYKLHTLLLLFTISIGTIAFVGAGYCLVLLESGFFVLVTVGVACIWLTKILYDSSNTAVFFEQDGVRIVGGSYNNYRYLSWAELTHMYYARNYKKHLFLVLSQRGLSAKEIKSFANRCANSSKILIDDVIVIYIDILQNTSQLKVLIDSHIDGDKKEQGDGSPVSSEKNN